MEKDACIEQKNYDAAVDQAKQQPSSTLPYRYTKVMINTTEKMAGHSGFVVTELNIVHLYTGGTYGNKRTANLQ